MVSKNIKIKLVIICLFLGFLAYFLYQEKHNEYFPYYVNKEKEKAILQDPNLSVGEKIVRLAESVYHLKPGDNLSTDIFYITDFTTSDNGADISVEGNKVYLKPHENENYAWVVLHADIKQPFHQMFIKVSHEGDDESENVVTFGVDGDITVDLDERLHFPDADSDGRKVYVTSNPTNQGPHFFSIRVDRYGEYKDSGVTIELLETNFPHPYGE